MNENFGGSIKSINVIPTISTIKTKKNINEDYNLLLKKQINKYEISNNDEKAELQKYVTFKNINEFVLIDEQTLIPLKTTKQYLNITKIISEKKNKLINMIDDTLDIVINYMKNNYDEINIDNQLIKYEIINNEIGTFDVGFEYFLSKPRINKEFTLIIQCENLNFKKSITKTTIHDVNYNENIFSVKEIEKSNEIICHDLEKIKNTYLKFIMSYLIVKSKGLI